LGGQHLRLGVQVGFDKDLERITNFLGVGESVNPPLQFLETR